jgi:hypothetical protein
MSYCQARKTAATLQRQPNDIIYKLHSAQLKYSRYEKI